MKEKKTETPSIAMIEEEQRRLLDEIKVVHPVEQPYYNSKTIFYENKPYQGILFKEKVRKDFKNFNLKELALLKYLFEAITNRDLIITSRFPEKDKEGKDCFWIRTNGVHGHLSYKVPAFFHLGIILENYLILPHSLNFGDFYNEVFS